LYFNGLPYALNSDTFYYLYIKLSDGREFKTELIKTNYIEVDVWFLATGYIDGTGIVTTDGIIKSA